MILGRLENDRKWNYGIGFGRRPDMAEQYPIITFWCFKSNRPAQDEDEVGLMQQHSKGFYIRITLLGIKIDRRI